MSGKWESYEVGSGGDIRGEDNLQKGMEKRYIWVMVYMGYGIYGLTPFPHNGIAL